MMKGKKINDFGFLVVTVTRKNNPEAAVNLQRVKVNRYCRNANILFLCFLIVPETSCFFN